MAEEIVYSQVQEYLETLVPPRPDELVAMELHARQNGFPIIGPAAGQLCYQLARLIGARNVFELGSGYGYSTAWFARAVQENGGGEVHHVVWDESLSQLARDHLARLGYAETVRYHVGEAVAMLRTTAGPFDLIFNDIDKHAYPDSLPVITEKLRPGGLLIFDNMLWHGRIFNVADRDASTEGVRNVTQMLARDPRWIVSLLPVRDGLIVAQRV
jgi:caffeoyl-CoA O-methyltransferase